jgi:hypothetical protein
MTAEEAKWEIESISCKPFEFHKDAKDLCCQGCEKGEEFYNIKECSCYYHGITEDEFLNKCLNSKIQSCDSGDLTKLTVEMLSRRLEKILTSMNERLQKLEERLDKMEDELDKKEYSKKYKPLNHVDYEYVRLAQRLLSLKMGGGNG